MRLCALFVSPLELYPDEAQYWVWSRRLGLGYFSKPPLIAWAIRATTALGSSQAEPWVRLSAPLFHAVAAFALGRAGARLYGPAAGLAAAVIYSLMPGVQLSSAVIATDAPLMAFLSLAVWAYAVFWTTPTTGARRRAAAGLGAALGLAMLAKYAAVYVGLGVAVHALISVEARRRWDLSSIVLAGGLLLLMLGPNIGWNLAHGLSTLVHTADAADWRGRGSGAPAAARSLFDPRQAPGFLLSQFGVFGPVPFAVLLIGSVRLAAAGRKAGRADESEFGPLAATDRMLLCLALPALAIALIEAAVARANANWAAAAYAAGSVLAAGWLVRWRARRAMLATVALQGLLAALFLAVFAKPELADGLGLSNSLKRARGWSATTAAVLARAQADRPAVIAADDRFLFNALAYYGREALARPGAPPLRMWVRETKARNEAEATEPLTVADGQGRATVAAISYPAEAAADFSRVEGVERRLVPLDPRRRLQVTLFTGEGFAPRPRDPETGRPYRPPPLP